MAEFLERLILRGIVLIPPPDATARVITYPLNTSSANQVWRDHQLSDGYFYLMNLNSAMVLYRRDSAVTRFHGRHVSSTLSTIVAGENFNFWNDILFGDFGGSLFSSALTIFSRDADTFRYRYEAAVEAMHTSAGLFAFQRTTRHKELARRVGRRLGWLEKQDPPPFSLTGQSRNGERLYLSCADAPPNCGYGRATPRSG